LGSELSPRTAFNIRPARADAARHGGELETDEQGLACLASPPALYSPELRVRMPPEYRKELPEFAHHIYD
jgi:hypothetical protein